MNSVLEMDGSYGWEVVNVIKPELKTARFKDCVI